MAETLTEEQENQIIIFIADDILRNLNLNGIIEATKIFSLDNAKRQYAELSDEDKQKVIGHMKELEENPQAQANQEYAPDLWVPHSRHSW